VAGGRQQARRLAARHHLLGEGTYGHELRSRGRRSHAHHRHVHAQQAMGGGRAVAEQLEFKRHDGDIVQHSEQRHEVLGADGRVAHLILKARAEIEGHWELGVGSRGARQAWRVALCCFEALAFDSKKKNVAGGKVVCCQSLTAARAAAPGYIREVDLRSMHITASCAELQRATCKLHSFLNRNY
jgi:hypothetical protein